MTSHTSDDTPDGTGRSPLTDALLGVINASRDATRAATADAVMTRDHDEDEPVVMDDDLRQLAWDVLGSREAVQALWSLLRNADALQGPELRGLAVLLEGARTRLDLALEALCTIARDLRVEGLPHHVNDLTADLAH